MSKATGPEVCVCGRSFQSRRAALPHWRVCPAERKRSEDFLATAHELAMKRISAKGA